MVSPKRKIVPSLAWGRFGGFPTLGRPVEVYKEGLKKEVSWKENHHHLAAKLLQSRPASLREVLRLLLDGTWRSVFLFLPKWSLWKGLMLSATSGTGMKLAG